MKIDGGIGGLDTAAAQAASLEGRGYDGVMSAETSHDPFLPLLLAAQSTERVDLMTVDRGRVRPQPDDAGAHRVRPPGRVGRALRPRARQPDQAAHHARFSMPWSHPAARMREMILAIRAIWACWNDGTKLDFRGDFYTHTLMTPFFNPGPNPHGDARIFLAGVGELMTEVAGEVADGFICHGFTTRRYLRRGHAAAPRAGARPRPARRWTASRSPARCSWSPAPTRTRWPRRPIGVRQQIAFYGSTPAYRKVLELHGWGDLQDDLNRMSKEGRWEEMGDLIDDEILERVRRGRRARRGGGRR